jgi:hypothetical protein
MADSLIIEISQTAVLEIGTPGPPGASAVLADGVTSVTLRTASGSEFALSVDDDGVLTTTRL